MVLKVIGMLLAAVPFAFALIRRIETGADTRYLWVAFASALGAVVVLALPGPRTILSPARAGAATLVATACAALVAIMLGTRAGPGIAIVALAFGLCSALGTWLVIRSRAGRSR